MLYYTVLQDHLCNGAHCPSRDDEKRSYNTHHCKDKLQTFL